MNPMLSRAPMRSLRDDVIAGIVTGIAIVGWTAVLLLFG